MARADLPSVIPDLIRDPPFVPLERAAYEILTGHPIDWDKAERMEKQADEPWRKPSLREPDMIAARSHAGDMASTAMTAENGWLGDMVHGEDKRAELRAAVDEHRAAEGLEPVEWDGEGAEGGVD